MKNSVSVSAPNSVILVVGSEAAEPPESLNGGLSSATSTCIAIGTLSEFDGPTKVTVQTDPPPLDLPGGWTRVVYRIHGIHGAVKVIDVDWRELLALRWSTGVCEVVVDADDVVEPSQIRLSLRPTPA